MKKYSFNVLTEPWLPALSPEGDPAELGILQCLERAHELKEINHPAPIVEFGMYRLLTAFILDALSSFGKRPEHSLDVRLMLDEGQFNMEMIKEYAELCGDVFDIYHPERPFLQTKMGTEPLKHLAALFPMIPSGTNVSHWHHMHEEEFWASSAEAARLLTTIAPFMTAGGAGLSPSINGAPPLYALPSGASLFETILLNIIPRQTQETGGGKIAWRDSRLPGEERSASTLAEALTWRPRQIQLIPETSCDGQVLVKKMKFKRGDKAVMEWRDPNAAYRYEENKVTPLRMRENRPVWRDAGPLALLNKDLQGSGDQKVAFRRPDVVEQAFAVGDKNKKLQIQIYGMRTDMKMKIFEWTKTSMFIPSSLGASAKLGYITQNELNKADRAAYALRSSIKNLYPRGAEGNKNALNSLIDRSERGFWNRLEPNFYELVGIISSLPPDAEDDGERIDSSAAGWRQALKRIALGQFEAAARDMDADGDALERLVISRVRLQRNINGIIGGERNDGRKKP